MEYDPGTDPAAAAKLAGASDVAIVFVNQHTVKAATCRIFPCRTTRTSW